MPEKGSIQTSWSTTLATPGIFSAAHHQGGALPFVENLAFQGHNAVIDRHIERFRRGESLLFQLRHQLVENRLIADLAGRGLGGDKGLGQGPQQIGAADDADQLVAADHREALHPAPLHQIDDLVERSRDIHADDLAGHDVADLAAVAQDIGFRAFAGPEQEFDPARPALAGADFGAVEEIRPR